MVLDYYSKTFLIQFICFYLLYIIFPLISIPHNAFLFSFTIYRLVCSQRQYIFSLHEPLFKYSTNEHLVIFFFPLDHHMTWILLGITLFSYVFFPQYYIILPSLLFFTRVHIYCTPFNISLIRLLHCYFLLYANLFFFFCLF